MVCFTGVEEGSSCSGLGGVGVDVRQGQSGGIRNILLPLTLLPLLSGRFAQKANLSSQVLLT